MGAFEHATPAVLIVLILLVLSLLYFISKARQGADIFVRRIAGVDAVNEAVGRAAELGRPIAFSTGLTGVGPVLYACLGVIYAVVRRAAQYGTKVLLPQIAPDAMAIVAGVARDAYAAAGEKADFDPATVMFLSDEQFAYASGYIGLVHRENVAAAFLFGQFAGESLILAEAGQQVGAMQVAASTSPEQVAFFICACDYTLIGEELFAASAYLSREPVQLGSLIAQDRAKLALMLLLAIGILIASINSFLPKDKAISNVDTILAIGWNATEVVVGAEAK